MPKTQKERIAVLEEKATNIHDEVIGLREFKDVIQDSVTKVDTMVIGLHETLDLILTQTTKTNGRVTKLEKETDLVRVLIRYPKLTTLIIAGLAIVTIVDIADLIRFFIN